MIGAGDETNPREKCKVTEAKRERVRGRGVISTWEEGAVHERVAYWVMQVWRRDGGFSKCSGLIK
jgi:hypothetical protein